MSIKLLVVALLLLWGFYIDWKAQIIRNNNWDTCTSETTTHPRVRWLCYDMAGITAPVWLAPIIIVENSYMGVIWSLHQDILFLLVLLSSGFRSMAEFGRFSMKDAAILYTVDPNLREVVDHLFYVASTCLVMAAGFVFKLWWNHKPLESVTTSLPHIPPTPFARQHAA